MTDRNTTFEGGPERSHRHTSVLGGTPEHPGPYTSSSAAQYVGLAQRRRPSSRATSDGYPQHHSPACADTGKSRSRKARRDSSQHSEGSIEGSSSPDYPAGPEQARRRKEKSIVGSVPRLGRILEGRENRARSGVSYSNPTDENIPVHTQHPDGDTRLTLQAKSHNHNSLQQHDGRLTNLPNPSLGSMISGLTQQSSGSNSTITQESYDRNHSTQSGLIGKNKSVHTSDQTTKAHQSVPRDSTLPTNFHPRNHRRHGQEVIRPKVAMDGTTALAQPPSIPPRHNRVHNEARSSNHDRPSSSASSASSMSGHSEAEAEVSSNADESHPESPMTSPASTRDHKTPHWHGRNHSDSEYSVRESSPESVHLGGGNHYARVDDEDDEDDETEEEEGEEEEEESSEDDAGSRSGLTQDPGQHLALERVAPPRLPSATSSRHSDPHTRRLREQERQLMDHVLQSPQPHRDFHFAGGPSPQVHPAIPMYESYPYSGASPVSQQAPAPQPPAWPSAPPPVGYYSPPYVPAVPYSPGREDHFAIATRPPMGSLGHLVQPPQYQMQPLGPDMTRTTVAGYELMAEKLTTRSNDGVDLYGQPPVVPMYRKFEQLNHRVLLHLQDEISELEDELRSLDECIAQSLPRGEGGQIVPASRRREARYGGDLFYRRTEVLGKVFMKLGQYNQALSSFNTMAKSLDPASEADIQAYRTWIERRTPIDATEARFLDRRHDLLTVSRKRSAPAVGGAAPHQSAAIYLPLILVLPLMAFAMIPGLLGRLFIITLVGAVEIKVVISTELMDLMTLREWFICGSIYFGVMVVLAGVVH